MGFFGGNFFLGRAFGFVLVVRFIVVRFLAFACAFLKELNVPFIPAWAMNKAFWKSSMIFFMAILHHAIAESVSH